MGSCTCLGAEGAYLTQVDERKHHAVADIVGVPWNTLRRTATLVCGNKQIMIQPCGS